MKRTILIIVSVIAMISLIFYYGLKVNKEKYSTFSNSGYIISKIYDKQGNYLKSEKYYFNEGTKYKQNYNSEIVFNNANKEESKVSNDSFVHYDNGSISTVKKSAILNLDGISTKTAIKYYNIYPNSVLENKNNVYSINNIKTKIDFSNFLMKINENKYLLVGNNINLKIGDKEKKLDNGYYEIDFIEGDIVRIENNEVSYQNIPTNVNISMGNNINIDMNTKYISKNKENILNLAEMTIESNDNIDLIEVPSQDNKDENSETTEENKNNPINGIGSGIIGNENNNEDEEVNENTKEVDPQFSVTEMSVTANKFTSTVQVNDPSNLLSGDILIKIIDATSNKIVYQTKEIQGTMNLGIEVENLSPETSYLFIISSSYTKGGNLYTRDFVQKSFITESVGIDISKDYFTTDTLSFTVEKKEYSTIKSFDATLLDSKEKIVKNITVSFDSGNTNNLIFDSLESNKNYTLRINNYLYADSIITDSYINDKDYKTLKRRPTLGLSSFTIDKKNSNFTLKVSNTNDPDNGITSYRYEIYDARNINEAVQVIEKNSLSSVDVKVNDISLHRGLPYTFRVIAVFNDNEKSYEYETEFSEVMKMDGVQFPSIKFDEQEVTFEKIKGNIVITDNGNTISLDEGSKMTIIYTDSVGVSKTFTASGNLVIPFNVNYLRKNETYTISIYAKVDLQDGNEPIDSCFIGSTIVRTKDTNPMYLTYAINHYDTSNAFTIKAKLGPYNNQDTNLEANTMTGLIFNLYEGTSTSGTLAKTVRKVDRNLDEYVSELKNEYYDNQFVITPELFNLKNQDLKSEYYTIEVLEAYDYTNYKNKIDVINNIITTKTIGFVPSLPNNPDDSMDIKPIRNKDAGDKHRNDLDGETIIGYNVRGIYDNSNKYANNITYKLYNADNDSLIETKNYEVPSDGTIGYVKFYLDDGTKYGIMDDDFRRGNSYYFTYSVALDLNFDGTPESSYPSDTNVTLKSTTLTPEKQRPKVLMYPSNSSANTFTWKYKINDIDSAITEDKFYYSLNGSYKNPIGLIKSNNYESVTFSNLVKGYLSIEINQALIKKESNIRREQMAYQKFDGLFSPTNIRYTIYKEVNRVIFSFAEYQTNTSFDRVAGAKIVFSASNKTITKDHLSIVDGSIIIDYAEIESMVGLDITPTVYLYYDSGITGYDIGSSMVALQMIDNNTAEYDGKYYYMNTSSSFQTSYLPDKSLFNVTLNTNDSTLSILNKKTSITKIIDVKQESGGISYNYELLMPKAIKESIAINTSNPTFNFDKIIPCISLLNDKGALDISPTLISVKFKVTLFGAGGDRIKDNKIYLDIFKTDESGSTSEYVNTTTYTTDQLDGIISTDGLSPKTNYYAKFYAYILSGDKYVKEQLYDVDFQSNTKNYYFKTLGDVGISSIVAKYEAMSYVERQIKLTYNLREIVGYDRVEYEIYKIVKNDDGSTSDIKIDIPISNDSILSKNMTKYIDIPPGCGVEANESYRIIIRPYAVTTIGGQTEDIELLPNNSGVFIFNKIADPYVGISSNVVSNDSLEFKVNFYDTGKAVVDNSYNVSFYDDQGNEITPEEYKDVTYLTNASRKFILTGLTETYRYEIRVRYSINILNQAESIANREKKYTSTLIETDGISIGNFSVVTDVNDTSRIRLLFYDSYKLTDIDKIRYSIYSSSGYSLDNEEEFIPITITLDQGIVYYYYTLNTVLPSTGQYYLQLQFIKKNKVITEQSIEYNYIK